MDIQSLRLFVLASETLNISAAGRTLGMAPAVASGRLAKLENLLGAELLHRSTRKVSVSLEGQDFLPYARELIAQEEAALAAMGKSKAKIGGTLRFAAPSTFAQLYIAPLLPTFMDQYPDLTLDLHLSDAQFDLIEGSYDLALRNSSGRKRITLSHPTMDVTIVGNFGVVQQAVAGQLSRNGIWYDFFSGDSIEVFFPTQTVDLEPGEFKVLTSIRLDPPEADLLTGIEEISAEIPQSFELKQNYPNPFNPETTIEFQLQKAGEIELAIYNIAGQKVRTLASGQVAPGTYRTIWNGRNDADVQVASGIYLLRLKAGNEVRHRRMVLLK